MTALTKDSEMRKISIHALREEGDEQAKSDAQTAAQFLSTPSARRATPRPHLSCDEAEISIHALREEGDPSDCQFFPLTLEFLSTPSARRATELQSTIQQHTLFLSTPSARRATSIS